MGKYVYGIYEAPEGWQATDEEDNDPTAITMPESFDERWTAAVEELRALKTELVNAENAKNKEDARKAALELRWTMDLLDIEDVKELYDQAVHILEVDEWQKRVHAKIDAQKESEADA